MEPRAGASPPPPALIAFSRNTERSENIEERKEDGESGDKSRSQEADSRASDNGYIGG